jgi:hypothetical protein
MTYGDKRIGWMFALARETFARYGVDACFARVTLSLYLGYRVFNALRAQVSVELIFYKVIFEIIFKNIFLNLHSFRSLQVKVLLRYKIQGDKAKLT